MSEFKIGIKVSTVEEFKKTLQIGDRFTYPNMQDKDRFECRVKQKCPNMVILEPMRNRKTSKVLTASYLDLWMQKNKMVTEDEDAEQIKEDEESESYESFI